MITSTKEGDILNINGCTTELVKAFNENGITEDKVKEIADMYIDPEELKEALKDYVHNVTYGSDINEIRYDIKELGNNIKKLPTTDTLDEKYAKKDHEHDYLKQLPKDIGCETLTCPIINTHHFMSETRNTWIYEDILGCMPYVNHWGSTVIGPMLDLFYEGNNCIVLKAESDILTIQTYDSSIAKYYNNITLKPNAIECNSITVNGMKIEKDTITNSTTRGELVLKTGYVRLYKNATSEESVLIDCSGTGTLNVAGSISTSGDISASGDISCKTINGYNFISQSISSWTNENTIGTIPYVNQWGSTVIGGILDLFYEGSYCIVLSGALRELSLQSYDSELRKYYDNVTLKTKAIECTNYISTGDSFVVPVLNTSAEPTDTSENWHIYSRRDSGSGTDRALKFVGPSQGYPATWYLLANVAGGLLKSMTITHNAPINEPLESFQIGMPVFTTGLVHHFDYDNGIYKPGGGSPIDCITSMKTSGSYKQYMGICVAKHDKGDEIEVGEALKTKIVMKQPTIDFATHGDYYFRVNDSSYYEIGDIVLFDGNKLDDELCITTKIMSSIVGKVTGIIDEHLLAVFKD